MGEYATPARPAPGDDPRAGADSAPLEPLARARHPGPRPRRPRTRREPAKRHDRARPAGARRLPDPPALGQPRRSSARSATRTASSPRRAGRTRPAPTTTASADAGSARGSSTSGLLTSPPRAPTRSRRSAGSADASGWYSAPRLWALRGALDWLVGGPGLRRGRRDPERLRVGDTIDFWRVEGFEPDHLLRLRAEMRLPGRAWLQFEVEPGRRRIDDHADGAVRSRRPRRARLLVRDLAAPPSRLRGNAGRDRARRRRDVIRSVDPRLRFRYCRSTSRMRRGRGVD